MKRIPAIVLLALAACSGGSKSPQKPAAPETYTLVSVEQGDAACYVTVADSTGAEYTHPGSFDVCPGGAADASNFIGFPVALEWTNASIMAASCEGNPDCTDTEEVKAVSRITPLQR